jgi:prolyl-tRNA editing enzyme YbaK/EbsC (Cys-tRNA(Pro) deacylase)
VAVEAPLTPEAWPEPVQRVSTALREAGAEARVEEFPTGTPTAEDAARAVGCELRQIVKSLLFDCDGRAVLVLVPGDRRADSAKVAALTGARRARVAGPAQVEEATGYAPGAVAPFPLRQVEGVLIERSLLGESLLWVGAGSTRHMAGLPPTELVRVSRAQPVDVSEDV